MALDSDKFSRSIRACIENAKLLLADAEWISTKAYGLALALLAQEECSKAFVLALVRDGILPWTSEVRRSLTVHECKHLVTVIMEWLLAVNERRFEEVRTRTTADPPRVLPSDVAIAMNIYRHEMLERFAKRHPDRDPEWRGIARKLAEGARDRKKQRAMFVRVDNDGDLMSQPVASEQEFNEEFTRAKALIEFAGDVDRNCIFAFREYQLFADLFKAMFADLADPEVAKAREERFPDIWPGVVFVKRTVTVANVVENESEGNGAPTRGGA